MQTSAIVLFELRRYQGRLDEIAGPMETFADQYPAVPAWRCGLALLYAELGRDEDALAQIDLLEPDNYAALPRDANRLTGLALAAEAVSRIGAVGGFTQIRMRGSESNHTLVLIDGIKASDPYYGEFDFGTLAALEYAAQWQAKERRTRATV